MANFSLTCSLKALRHDILSHFFDWLNYGLSVTNLKIIAKEEKTKRVILEQGTRMAENGED